MLESGKFDNDYSCIEIGSGDKNVLIIPGYEDAILNTSSHSILARFMLRGFNTKECTARYVGRKQGLEEDYSTRDMARDYAEIIRPDTHVVGISLGGMIGLHLAYISDNVKTLTLCNSGPDDSREASRHLEANLSELDSGNWEEFFKGVMWDVDGFLKKKASYMACRLEKFKNPFYENDVRVSGRAALNHESWDLLERLELPVLLVTGEEDNAFTPEIIQKTHNKIERSRMEVVEHNHEYFYAETQDFYQKWEDFVSNKT